MIGRADEILNGTVRIWGTPVQIDGTPDWHKDPVTGFRWDVTQPSVPGRFLNESSPPGALRRIWEVNRQTWLFDLSRAHKATGNPAYRDTGILHITDWINENPPGTGVNWTSPLESAIRIVAWMEFIRSIGAENIHDDLMSDISRILYAAAKRTEWDLSLFPNPNNHLAGEALLLVMAGTLLKGARRLSHWRDTGLSLLNTYASNQFGKHGSPAEQSTGYLLFVSEIYLYASFLLHESRSRRRLSFDTRHRMASSLVFLNDLRNTLGYIPSVGDSDDARLFGWDHTPDTRLDGLLTLGSIFLHIPVPEPRRESNGLKLPARSFDPEYEAADIPDQPSDHSGWILIDRRGSPWGVLLLASPLGLPPLHGHGHAHALSTIISLSGHAVVIDPGTYSYGEKNWRDYFRSTRAHATVAVEDENQAQPVDTFTWRLPYSCRWKVVQNTDPIIIRTGHDGYKRLRQRVTHERIVQVSGGTVIVRDSLSGCTDLSFSASLIWPLHPSVAVIGSDDGTTSLGIGEQYCELSITGPGTPRIIRGETSPVNGWYSPVFEKREPSSTIRVDAVGRTVSWRTEFRLVE